MFRGLLIFGAVLFLGCEDKVIHTTTNMPTKDIDTPKVKEQTLEKKEEEFNVKVAYSKCASCHGTQALKSALGKSKIVAKMSEDEILNALLGYKSGSYGGSMKGIMKGQISTFSDANLKELATYIAKLN
jgi:cytochrome c